MNSVSHNKKIEHQLYHFQILSISIAILLSMSISLYVTIKEERDSLDRTISNVAAMISSMPEVIEVVESGTPSPQLNERLNALSKQLSFTDVITICDANSIRLYHTFADRIGHSFIGGDQYTILTNPTPYTVDGTGSLGPQRRSFYPILNSSGHSIGFVMVSVLTTSITKLINNLMLIFIGMTIFLITFGLLLAHHFYHRLKITLLGYNPEQLSQMYLERAEVLNALEEGIFAINLEGEVLVINDSARNMLDLKEPPKPKTKLIDIYPETNLLKTARTGVAQYNVSCQINGHHILSNRIPIVDHGKTVGAVSIFRDETKVVKLAKELTGAQHMVDTLRAFNHEFMNKLHVILGLIEIGTPEKAAELIRTTTVISAQLVNEVTTKIRIPNVSSLIIGKMIRANELGIKLTLKHDSKCDVIETHISSEIIVTILGNLIENAMEELNQPGRELKEIAVGIITWEDGIILSVDDTGHGIEFEQKEKVFELGFSTKGENRGTGMYLVSDLVNRYHGRLELETEPMEGTSFTITFTKESL